MGGSCGTTTRRPNTPSSVRSSLDYLDWANKPLPFKIYTGLDGIAPPEDIGRFWLLSNGVLRWRRHPGGGVYGFHAAPCTGALYHVELYLATADRADLPAGLYHYGAHDHALRRLRDGDVRGVLLEAAGGFPALADAPLVFILTSTFWRNSWKYRARAYRHAYWDSAGILANLLASTAAEQVRTAVVMGFADEQVNRLLGVDCEREASVAVLAIGEGAAMRRRSKTLPELDLVTMPLSLRQVRYPEIEEAHRASALPSGETAAAWRTGTESTAPGMPAALFPAPYDVIRVRRSTRRFRPGPIERRQLDRMLAAAQQPIPGDSFPTQLVEPFVIVNAVDVREPGVYGPGLRLTVPGDYRREAGALALGQALGAAAAANIYFLADLDGVFARLGGRGYRVAQMAGGIAGGRVELMAVAEGVGATGLTFFDDEVTASSSPPQRADR